MSRKLSQVFEWQEEMMTWLSDTLPEMPMCHKLYVIHVVFNRNEVIRDLVNQGRHNVDFTVAFDSFIGGKVLCMVLAIKYDAYGLFWEFAHYEKKSVYDQDGNLNVLKDIDKDNCIFHVPVEGDEDPVENLVQEQMRIAYEAESKDDAERTTAEKILSWDYFKAGWMRCLKQYLNVNVGKINNYDGIYMEAWKDNKCIMRFNTSSSDPGKEAGLMATFLDLERAVRLRGVDCTGAGCGSVMLTPKAKAA